ncbi:MAG: hypothetical protein ACR2HS_04410, partial [Gammaproteobacteria bacterium]
YKMQFPNWFQQIKLRETLKNLVLYGTPLLFTGFSFWINSCTIYPPNDSVVIFVCIITTASFSPVMFMLEPEKMLWKPIQGFSNRKFIAISAYVGCLSCYLGLSIIRMFMSGLNIPNIIIIDSFLGASTIMAPWLINNASYKFFTLSEYLEDLLDEPQVEILNSLPEEHNIVVPEIKETLKLELEEKLSEDPKKLLFTRFEERLPAVSSTNIELPVSTSSNNYFTDKTKPKYLKLEVA